MQEKERATQTSPGNICSEQVDSVTGEKSVDPVAEKSSEFIWHEESREGNVQIKFLHIDDYWTNEWTNECMDEWTNEWMNEQMHERMNELDMNNWMNKRMSKWTTR